MYVHFGLSEYSLKGRRPQESFTETNQRLQKEEEEEEALPAVQVQTLWQVGQLVSKTSSFDEHLRFHRHLTQRVISVDTVHAHRVGERIPTANKHASLRC